MVVAVSPGMVYGGGMTTTDIPKFDINIYSREVFGDPATDPEDKANFMVAVYEWEDNGRTRATKHLFGMKLTLPEEDYYEDDWFTEHSVNLPKEVLDAITAHPHMKENQ